MKIHEKLTSQNAGAEGEGEQGLVLKAKASRNVGNGLRF
jgi:hypothetical protein